MIMKLILLSWFYYAVVHWDSSLRQKTIYSLQLEKEIENYVFRANYKGTITQLTMCTK